MPKTRTTNKQKELLSFLEIISETNRLKILDFLREEKRCVCEIWKELKIPQNLASHHLKILKDFELISSKQDKKEGRKIIYSLNKKTLKKHTSQLNKFLTFTL